MLRKLLICGLAAGACGGLLAAGFASLAGESRIDRAIAYEHARVQRAAQKVGIHHELVIPGPVSRGVQKGAGLLTASLLYGVALGGVFAIVFALAYGRVADAPPRTTAYWLAATSFLVVYLVPLIKYPPSPPGATNPSTIGRRTLLYVTMIAMSALAVAIAVRIRPALERRLGGHAAKLGAMAVFLVVVVAAGAALPSINETPADFPATTLWSFREASIGVQAVLWLTIALVFAPAAQRVMTGQAIIASRLARSAALPPTGE